MNYVQPTASRRLLRSPDYDLAIDSVKTISYERFDGGVYMDKRYRLSDGTAYIGRLTLPQNDTYHYLLSHRLPWFTDLDGLYTLVDQEHARRGSTSIRVSPQQTSVVKASKNLINAVLGDNDMLTYDSYAHHLILDHIDDLGYTVPKRAIESGDSKNAMTNLSVQAYARRFGRLMVYNDITDPCLEHAPDYRNITPEEVLKNAKYLAIDEPLALVRALGSHSRKNLLHIRKTVPLRPGFMVHQAATGVALFSGKSGGFVEHLPADSVTAVRFFRHSEFNHALSWLVRLAPFNNIYPYKEDGSHLSIADWNVQESTIDRIELVQQLLKSALAPQELRASLVVERIAKLRLAASAVRSSRAARRPAQTAS